VKTSSIYSKWGCHYPFLLYT